MRKTITAVAALGVLAVGMTLPVLGQSATGLPAQLMRKDSILFAAALNTCNVPEVQSVFAPEFRYEQDGGEENAPSCIGLDEFVDRIRSRCAKGGVKVRRETSQVQSYPQGSDRAIQTGVQRFYLLNPGQPDQLVETSRFSRSWKKQGGDWKMTHELDYPVGTGAAPAGPPAQPVKSQPQTPLYETIAQLDNQLFAAYNNRELEKLVAFFATDLEFYHDRGGLTDYAQNVALFAKNFSQTGQGMRRELVPGTLEVYPIGQYGALQVGVHRFYSTSNGTEQLVATAKFTQVWKNENGKWLVTREISYDHQ